MMRALWTAATGMTGQQMNVDVISNNLANASTNGFKTSGTTNGVFSKILEDVQVGKTKINV